MVMAAESACLLALARQTDWLSQQAELPH